MTSRCDASPAAARAGGRTGFARLVTLLTALCAAALGAAALGACSGDGREPQVLEFVVPEGTWQRLLLGDEVEIMPTRVELYVGDTLRVRNEDSVPQYVGPYYVRGHSEFELTYGAPGTFEGTCTLSEGGRYEIIVRE